MPLSQFTWFRFVSFLCLMINQPTCYCCLNFCKQSLMIYTIKGFRTIVFFFNLISTTLRPICPLALYRRLSNSGTYWEL